MGGCVGVGNPKAALEALQGTIFGECMSAQELTEFALACKVERFNRKTTPLKFSSEIAFYVVVTGEVCATLSSDSSSSVVTTYASGEVALFLPTQSAATRVMEFDGHVLSFVAESRSEGSVRLLTMDKATLKAFLDLRPHLKDLAELCVYTDTSQKLLDSPTFRGLSAEKIQLMLMVMKFKFCKPGQLVRCEILSDDRAEMVVVPSKSMGVLLKGTCIYMSDVEEARAIIKQQLAGEISPSSLRHSSIYPGSSFGLENHYIYRHSLPSHSIVASSPAIMGYVLTSALDAITQADAALRRRLRGNYYRHILDAVREGVPLLNELDDRVFDSLCCKIALRGYGAQEEIFKAGAPSDYSYICVHGSVQETAYIHQLGAQSTNAKSVVQSIYTDSQTDVKVWGPLSLFGEVSLLTGMPYFSTTIALEATILVCISKRTLDMLYSQDGAKLASLRLCLCAPDQVPLSLVLQHPEGNKIFSKFLQSQHCEESLRFYNAATHYQSLANTLLHRLRGCGVAALEALRDYCLDQLCDPNALENAQSGSLGGALALPGTRGSRSNPARNEEEEEEPLVELHSTPSEGGLTRSSSFSTTTASASGIFLFNMSTPSTSASYAPSLSKVPPAAPSSSAAKPVVEVWRYTHTSSIQLQEALLALLRDLRNISVHICREYIESNSAMEVNISHSTRSRTLDMHRAFIQQNIYGCMITFVSDLIDAHAQHNCQHPGQGMGTIREEGDDDEDDDNEKLGSESQKEQAVALTHPTTPVAQSRPKTPVTQAAVDLSKVRLKVEGEDIHALFQEAQQEVYKLMHTDGFARFRASTDFVDFMRTQQPQGLGKEANVTRVSMDNAVSVAMSLAAANTRQSVFDALPFTASLRPSFRGLPQLQPQPLSLRRSASPKVFPISGSNSGRSSFSSHVALGKEVEVDSPISASEEEQLVAGMFVTSSGSERRHRNVSMHIEALSPLVAVSQVPILRRSSRLVLADV